MNDFAELEINLVTIEENKCRAQLRYRAPGSLVETRLGMGDAAAPLVELSDPGDETLDVDSYARTLTGILFSNPGLLQPFADAITSAAAANAILRIRLWIDSPTSRLHDIRWETLLNPRDDTRLSAGERILFSRGMSSQNAIPITLNPPEEANALLVVANPSDLARYKLAPINEQTELSRASTDLAGLRSIVTLPGKGGRATFDNIFAALAGNVDVLFLVCHGTIASDEAWLWLEGPDGKTRRVSAADFVARMRGLSTYPELVVLASCQSAGGQNGSAWRALGPRLVDAGVPAVLAMQGNFSMASEAEFMPRFFQSLREHGEADRALSFARSFIIDNHDWWMPALFSRMRDNRIFARTNPNAAPDLARKHFEPETVYIPSGVFLMGSDEPNAPFFVKPRHPVRLAAFRMGKYPLTNRQYAEFVTQTRRIVPPEMGWAGQTPPSGQENFPVQGVTWYDAMDYCKWLSEKTGRTYRLPTEAEWEKAARGEDGRRYPWGDDWDAARCSSGVIDSLAVDAYPAQSVYGCYDMVGNIREWTLSLWGPDRLQPAASSLYPWAEDARNDINASKLIRRVIRGAGQGDTPESLTCFARNAYVPDRSGPPGKRHGFRVVMEI
jgi:formylglycine-generating enzyme required for sulfatase activity